MTGLRLAVLAGAALLLAGCSQPTPPAPPPGPTPADPAPSPLPPATPQPPPPSSPQPPANPAPPPEPTPPPPSGPPPPAQPPPTPPPQSGPGPVLDAPLADPFVLAADGTYVLVGTNEKGENVPAYTSRNLAPGSWRSAGDALPELPGWARKGKTWAPEIVRARDGYRLYFAAWSKERDLHCIGVAKSDVASGPYRPAGNGPVVCDEDVGGAIDANPFVDDDGSAWLLWKTASLRLRKPTWIKAARLNAAGTELEGGATALIREDQKWEGASVEAPTLHRRGGRYVLFYSGAAFNSPRYAVGFATSSKLLGPYTKFDGNPILSSSPSSGYGPGHQALVRDRCGTEWLVFHAWPTAATEGRRFTRMAALDWHNGRPVLDLSRPPGACR